MIKFLSQQEIQPPKNIEDYMDDEFFKKLNSSKPPSIVMMNWPSDSELSGCCHSNGFTEQGEVAINSEVTL
jgi:hypothetical protein